MSAHILSVKEWREKAFIISSLEPEIGTVTSMVFDLIITVTRDGVSAQNLLYPVKSLQREWEYAYKHDRNRHAHLRTLLYGLSESLGLMVRDVVENLKKANEEALPIVKEEPTDVDSPDARLKSVKEWREKASEISNSDPPMGTLISRALELIIAVMRDGVEASHLQYSIDSLRREREYAMENDSEKNASLRSLLYGMSGCLGTMLKDVVDKNKQKEVEIVDAFKQELEDDDEQISNAQESTSVVAPLDRLLGQQSDPVKLEPLESEEKTEDQANTPKQRLFSDRVVKSEELDFPDDGSNYDIGDFCIEDDAPGTSSKHHRKPPRLSGSSHDDPSELRPLRSTSIRDLRKEMPSRKRARVFGANTDDVSERAGTSSSSHDVVVRPLRARSHDSDEDEEEHMIPGYSDAAATVSRCHICSMTFPEADDSGLQKHVKMHKGFDCLVCYKYLVNGTLLAAHMASEHPFFIAARYKLARKVDKRYQCELCPQTCRTPSALKQHERTHTGQRPFVCTIPKCTSSFVSSSFLKAHQRESHGLDPHQCEVCEERFSRFEELRIHWAEKRHRKKTIMKKGE